MWHNYFSQIVCSEVFFQSSLGLPNNTGAARKKVMSWIVEEGMSLNGHKATAENRPLFLERTPFPAFSSVALTSK